MEKVSGFCPQEALLAGRQRVRYKEWMSLLEIKEAVTELSPEEFADLNAFMRERENAEWDRQLDEDFAEGGRLRGLLEEARADLRAGRVEEMP